MAKLSHPNVVAVYDVGDTPSGLVLVMEYVRGQSLRTWLSEQRRPRAEILRRFGEAGRGLAAAHGEGLLHRDFKPGNVLIPEQGVAKVTDFGLAKLASVSGSLERSSSLHEPESLDTSLTVDGMIIGTPAYMAPEQHLGKTSDPAVDQFAVLRDAMGGADRPAAVPRPHPGPRAGQAPRPAPLARRRPHAGARGQGAAAGAGRQPLPALAEHGRPARRAGLRSRPTPTAGAAGAGRGGPARRGWGRGPVVVAGPGRALHRRGRSARGHLGRRAPSRAARGHPGRRDPLCLRRVVEDRAPAGRLRPGLDRDAHRDVRGHHGAGRADAPSDGPAHGLPAARPDGAARGHRRARDRRRRRRLQGPPGGGPAAPPVPLRRHRGPARVDRAPLPRGGEAGGAHPRGPVAVRGPARGRSLRARPREPGAGPGPALEGELRAGRHRGRARAGPGLPQPRRLRGLGDGLPRCARGGRSLRPVGRRCRSRPPSCCSSSATSGPAPSRACATGSWPWGSPTATSRPWPTCTTASATSGAPRASTPRPRPSTDAPSPCAWTRWALGTSTSRPRATTSPRPCTRRARSPRPRTSCARPSPSASSGWARATPTSRSRATTSPSRCTISAASPSRRPSSAACSPSGSRCSAPSTPACTTRTTASRCRCIPRASTPRPRPSSGWSSRASSRCSTPSTPRSRASSATSPRP